MVIRNLHLVWAGVLATLLGCQAEGPGGITAHLVFKEAPGRQALRAQAVPALIDHLQITALDVAGSTLATTHLRLNPGEGEQTLLPGGGSWALEKVPSGDDRVILAKAFLGDSPVPRLNRALAYVGQRDQISVRPGQVSDIGTLELRPAPIRIPETDQQAPGPPNPVTVLPVPTGGALRVTFQRPSDPDVAGYVLAVARTASVAITTPTIAPKTQLTVGDDLAPGVTVRVIWPFSRTEIITIDGLEDGVPYAVLVYAYDGDDPEDPAAGNPLNFSLPAKDFGTPLDATPPLAPTGLTALPTPGGAQISFVAPADERGGGLTAAVGGFELRAALALDQLNTAASFVLRPEVAPPPAAPPGTTVSVTRSLSELGVPAGTAFYVGLRALDQADNPGPIAVAQLSYNATVAPQIDMIAPPFGLAGREVTLQGRDFGVTRGVARIEATETSTLSYPLTVARWSNTEVVVILSGSARSGHLVLERPDGQSAQRYLSVLAPVAGPVDEYEAPFELLSRGSLSVLYAETRSGPTGALERFLQGINEGIRYAPRVASDRSTVIRGAYSSALQLYWFVSADEPNSMSASFIDSSTTTPFNLRLDQAVEAGQADGLGLAFLPSAPGPAAGMVAFTIAGVLRTATVADVRTDRFNGFYAQSSTVVAYDQVRLGQKSNGELLLAHRQLGTTDTLVLWSNPGGLDPNGFIQRPADNGPETGPGIEVAALPAASGEDFVIAYEAREPSGRYEVRLLRAADYGQTRGYAPFAAIGGDRRLDDLGLVRRDGAVYLAVLASRIGNAVEPVYTEVPLSALLNPGPDGSHPGVALDTAPIGTAARLGCKGRAQGYCPILVSSRDAALLFLRR